MTLKISELYGMTDDIAEKLKAEGMDDSEKLLAAVAQPADRKKLAVKLGMNERSLLELGNRADLARIKGIGAVYSDLLEYAGVDTVAELAQRNPDNLYVKLVDVGKEHSAKRLPTQAEVSDWVDEAKALGRGIFY